MTAQVLVVDVGTSSVRASLVAPDGSVTTTCQQPMLPATPEPGLVELDAAAMAEAVLTTARAALGDGTARAVGVTNQRATTVVWDAESGEPVGPAIGWQDLRTVLECLTLQADGVRVAPNMSATKARWLVARAVEQGHDAKHLRVGTVDTWVVRALTGGALHVTDATNAGVTGLVETDGTGWDARVLEVLGLDPAQLPTIVDTVGVVGEATALPGAPPIAAVVGDQQGSLAGQGCLRAGQAKCTFGTGAMLDLVLATRPAFTSRGRAGCYPIVARRRGGRLVWGLEGAVLTAGACVEWLRDGLGLVDDAASTEGLAASVPDTGGVAFVPALLGMGTPDWDFGARGGFFGMTRGTSAAHLCRAVLEGIAQRGADLVESAEHDGAIELATLRTDGGMTANATFLQLLADAVGRPVEVAPEREATTRGAALLAALGAGLLQDEAAVEGAWTPSAVVEPSGSARERADRRAAWLAAKAQALATIPSLSGVSFN